MASATGSTLSSHHRLPSISSNMNFNDMPWLSQTPIPQPQMNRRDSAQQSRQRQSVSVACMPCRNRHLKCGGGDVCSRCQNEGLKCYYMKSRRGFKGPRKSKQQPGSVPPVPGMPAGDIQPPGELQRPQSMDRSESVPRTSREQSNEQTSPPQSLQVDNMYQAYRPPDCTSTQTVRCTIRAFFVHFHPSHPFLLPREQWKTFLSTGPPPHLEYAVRFVGSIYLGNGQSAELEQHLCKLLFEENPQRNGELVQALLICAIGNHMSGDPDRAAMIMDSAIDIALDIGMNRAEFALQNGNGDSLHEEMWRRTWWELYIIDAMISASIQRSTFRLQNVTSTVALPCEEEAYRSRQIPTPRTLDDYDSAVFMGDQTVFSSFTYLIDAIRLLGQIMSTQANDPYQLQPISILETSLANFALHLPEEKRVLVGKSGQFDEVLFQAHMVAASSSILLHRPRSNLTNPGTKNAQTCIKPDDDLYPTQDRAVHTAQTIRAAETISKLSTLPTPLMKHTPFFTCMVTQAAVVHLSYWTFLVPETEDAMIKQQVRLDIGVLRTLSETWPIGKRTLDQVTGIAQDMFAARRAMNTNPWGTMGEEELMQVMMSAAQEVPPVTAEDQLALQSMMSQSMSQPMPMSTSIPTTMTTVPSTIL